eukprot:XP_025015745.1 hybrid signal transduction histidine kinase A isoform X2 [Ricinus communis]
MSSSGGDDEYDSRAESSISAFLNHSNNNNPLTHVGPMPNPPPPPPDHHHHQHQTHHSMFDPLSNYFDPLSSSRPPPPLTHPNSLLNLDMVWSKNLRSDTNCTDLGGFIATSSSPTQQFFTNQTQTGPTYNPSIQIPPVQETTAPSRGPGSASASGSNGHQTNNTTTTNIVRNPKKRSRASRRAPTTVLTTDTTNFRAMVQEFTGIPAPPFTSSPFPRSRLDLFGTAAASSLRSVVSHLEPSHPSYLLRPFAQKIQPPFLSSSSSSSMIDAIASSTTTSTNINSNATTNTTTNTTSNSDLSLLKYPQNLLNINMHNSPMLNFHSLFQPSPKYSLPNSSILATKPQEGSLDTPSNDPHLKMGVLEEFGLSHGHVSTNLTGLHNLVSSSDTTLRRSDHNSSSSSNNNNNNSGNWGDRRVGSNEGDHLLRSINGNYNNNNSSSNTQRVVANNGKVNYSASSSDFNHGDKGPETNVVVANTRSEGMVESWICSSD